MSDELPAIMIRTARERGYMIDIAGETVVALTEPEEVARWIATRLRSELGELPPITEPDTYPRVVAEREPPKPRGIWNRG